MSSRLYCLAVLSLSFVFYGCSQAPNEPAGTSAEAAIPSVFNPTGAPTVEFSVPDMMCEDGCAVKVHEILSKQAGARDVIVNFDAKRATVAIEEGVFDNDAAIAALVDHGFDNSRLKAADGAKPPADVH